MALGHLDMREADNTLQVHGNAIMSGFCIANVELGDLYVRGRVEQTSDIPSRRRKHA